LWALIHPEVKKSHFIVSFFGICMTLPPIESAGSTSSFDDKEKALMNASRPNFLSQSACCVSARQQEYSPKAEPSSAEILFLYSEITIRSSTSIEGKGEGNVGALDVGRLRGNFARYGGSLEEFQAEYNTEMCAEVVMYIKSNGWNLIPARRLLHAFILPSPWQPNYFEREAAHWC